MNSYAVFIGRFQPPTLAHKKIIKKALSENDYLIIVIGSYMTASTIKNPWNFEQRKELILGMFKEDIQQRLFFIAIKDYPYDDQQWVTYIQNRVYNIAGNSHIKLYGHFKDNSSYYLKYFPDWELINCKKVNINKTRIDATKIRKMLFDHFTYGIDKQIDDNVYDFLMNWTKTKDYQNLLEDYLYYQTYQQPYKELKYKPIFNTVDCVVKNDNNILLIKRKNCPGKDLYALPGGFLNSDEWIVDAAIRELIEETSLIIPEKIIRDCIVKNKVYDYPYRSLRGRLITTAFLIDLSKVNNQKLIVKGSDDASSAEWISLDDVYKLEDKFFDDHFHIIKDIL